MSSAARSIFWLVLLAASGPALELQAQHLPDCRSSKGPGPAGRSKGGGDPLWPFDVHHQKITLDLTQGNVIHGSCTVLGSPRGSGLEQIPLHLLGLTVDSVTSANGPLSHLHAGELLEVFVPEPIDPLDTVEFTVHYHGDPVIDASGFGGFYTSGNTTYNLGVAFQSIPHSFGRAWFPCVDNFTERNSYEFLVRTHAGRKAWCNGALLSETSLGGDTIVRHWRLEETIPAYLASVAASDFAEVRDTLPSMAGTAVPVSLVARPPDTTNMKNSFVHLADAFDRFEAWFGPYRWNKVGYVLTDQGAMEHSTSIHYPRSIANGSLTYENIMAHELAHQWFGDLITCARAEEMWINEGCAEYLSYLFLEEVYGPDRYMREVRSNHRRMVQRAHLVDEGWWSLAEVPQQWTYGEHSYNKGADVMHTLRGYLGDELFIAGFTSVMEAYAYQPIGSAQLRDHLTAATGMDLTDFFDDWIFQPGWAAFEVDSFRVDPPPIPNGPHPTTVHISQKQRGPSTPYNNVPVTISCVSDQGDRWTAPTPTMLGGPNDTIIIGPPFVPSRILLNADDRLSLAVTADEDTLTGLGINDYSHADLRITVDALPSPASIRIEEFWVPADSACVEPFAYSVSPDRWWRIVAVLPEGASLRGRISYDGRTTIGSLDAGLMQDFGGLAFREDSLVLLYREDQHQPWSVHGDFTVVTLNSPTDKVGRVEFNDLRAGEYTLGWRKSATSMDRQGRPGQGWSWYPNPAQNTLNLDCMGDLPKDVVVRILDAAGRTVLEQRVVTCQQQVDVDRLANGRYLLGIQENGTMLSLGDLVIAR